MAVSAVAVALVLASCGSAAEGPASVPTRDPATPVASPPTASPIGSVTMLDSPTTVVGVAAEAQTLLVQATGPDKLIAWNLGGPDSTVNLGSVAQEFDLPEGAGTAVLTADGEALIPSPSGLTVVSLADGGTRTAEVTGTALSAAKTTDGRYAVGTDNGSVVILGSDLTPERTVTGFVSVDGLAAANGVLVALDTHQTSATEINVDDGSLSGALRVGIGATGIIADHYGRIIAADTDGGQIVVFSVDPLLNRQMGPAGESPFGLADDATRNLVWVTLTGTNEVAAFDLSSGAPDEKFRLPTIQDPQSVAVDEQSGDLYIGSSTTGAVQRIPSAEIR
ncbi:YncE family protein [Tomitella biformata]|uniref:YncE family protein n=1 Tax=Tomitella biformata TaxID=630403 RepID=UPI000464CB91|nr:hypothetical protein [Tomitella biformata]